MDIPFDYNNEEEDEEKVDLRALTKQLQDNCLLTGWSQLLLKEQLKRALRECNFFKPSEVQSQSLPHTLNGKDIICQAKSGMGKTAVFILSILQTLSIVNGDFVPFSALIVVHTRELAHQIQNQFRRMSEYFKEPKIQIGCYFGGIDISFDIQNLKTKPHIVIGTPGRLKQLTKNKLLDFSQTRHLVLDECDNVLNNSNLRKDFNFLFDQTPLEKQMMMVSATFTEEVKKEAKKYMNCPVEVFIDPGELTIHGLKQFYLEIPQQKKVKYLIQLLTALPFNQVIIFANKVKRVTRLATLLKAKMFTPFEIHSNLSQKERILTYDAFKAGDRKILVATDLFGRGIDIERVNLVINFDFPYDKETYLHRVGRAGRFGTKGVAVNFVNPDPKTYAYERDRTEPEVLEEVQNCFKVKIDELPKTMNISRLMQ